MLHRRRIYRSGLRADQGGSDPIKPTPGPGKPNDPGGGGGRGNSGGRGGGRGDNPPGGGAGSGGAANPVTSGLVRYLDADLGTFQTDGGAAAAANNDPVGSWVDQVTGTAKAVQATAGRRPLLVTNAYNGHKAIRFDGGDDQLLMAGAADEQVPNVTVFAVANATATGRLAIAKPDQAASWNSPWARWIAYINGSNQLDMRWNGTQSLSAAGAWPTGQLKVLEMVNAKWTIDGTLAAAGTDADLTYPNGLTPIAISGNLIGSEMFAGDFTAVLVYNRSLSRLEASQVRAWLAARYGVTPVVTIDEAANLYHVASSSVGWASGGGDLDWSTVRGNFEVGDRIVFGCVANASSIDPNAITGATTLLDEETSTGLRRSIFTKQLEAADLALTGAVTVKGGRFFGMDFVSIYAGPKANVLPVLTNDDRAIGAANVQQDGVGVVGAAGELAMLIGSLGYNVGTLTATATPAPVTRRTAGVAGSGNRVNLTVDEVPLDGATTKRHRLTSTGTAALLGSIAVRFPSA